MTNQTRLAVSQTPTTITVVDQTTAQVYTITNTQPNWAKVVEALKQEDNDDEVLDCISVKNAVETFVSTKGAIKVVGNDVLYKNHQLHGMDVDDLLEAIRTGNKRQAKALTAFLENKQLNPSYKAVQMMYVFRRNKNMPLTEDGCFLAYKGVQKDYWSRNANKQTIVLSGQVNEQGQILNTVGAYIEVDRKCVEDDPAKTCGEGLHAGSLEYATGWGERVVIVKIHPKDVVSVPSSEDNKMRVCAYTVVGECEGVKLPEHFDSDLDHDDLTDDGDDDATDDGCTCDDETCVGCGASDSDEGGCDSYSEGYDEGEDDALSGSGPAHDITGEAPPGVDPDWFAGYVDGYECNKEKEGSASKSYNEGRECGEKDGRAHSARQYYAGDEHNESNDDNVQYVIGYNDGYNYARYGK